MHISYNLDFKKYSPETDKEKKEKVERKNYVRNTLRSEPSLPVDTVKHGGGISDTGNVARSFFEQATSKEVSQYTGLDFNIMKRFHNILQVLTCGKMIKCNKFEQYYSETAIQWLDLWESNRKKKHKALSKEAKAMFY